METGELFESVAIPKRATRKGLRHFLFHEKRHGDKVLPVFCGMVEEAMKRGWNLPIGSITLAGGGRMNVEGFTLTNNLAPFYVAAVAIMRPDLRAVIDIGEDFLESLRCERWEPTKRAEGGARRD